MKNILFILAASIFMGGCDHSNHNHDAKSDAPMQSFYGETFEVKDPISATSIPTLLASSDSVAGQFEGKIVETCRAEGCWMTVALENGEELMVYTNHHKFFVPTSGAGDLKCVLNGYAFPEEVSVEMLQHYAEDAGKSEEEIAMITAPEKSFSFMATGVMIEGYDPSKAESGEEHEEHDHDHDHEGHEH
ncbi:MAG: DUF4920 domain-containing protein [Flavobacteriales bacterium]